MIQFVRDRLRAATCTALAALAVSTATAGTLPGTAACRERTMLSPDAVFEAQSPDISLIDAPAVAPGCARLDTRGHVVGNIVGWRDGMLEQQPRRTMRQ